ncbi:hypothetical protein MRB53_016900 [Persea americana]|uniref:Uncharacterized protein n=1 Tax=Persea americana TaxID=3435 RepID=A0ACC2M4E3_PERAE|nr:hypothetical protein MRB53_016900 [Persea americana]
MDNANLYKDESLHQNGSSIWSMTTLEDVFARSSHDEDDEAALKWAALEKLPTYNRIRKGFLSGVAGGELEEVNIKDLGYQERKNLLERLIKVGEEDLEKFLLKVKNRIERVGIELPTIEVRFEHLSIEGEAYVGSRGYDSQRKGWRCCDPTTRKCYTSRNVVFDEASSWWSSNKEVLPDSEVFKEVSPFQLNSSETEVADEGEDIEEGIAQNPWQTGIYQRPSEEEEPSGARTPIALRRSTRSRKPNPKYANAAIVEEADAKEPETFEEAMTLQLGPPGSGKTSLLIALAGKLDKDLKVSGRVTYNAHGMDEFVPQRTSAYISQYDTHIGEMTVRETLAFSARCQGVGARYEMLQELSRREKEANIKPDPETDVFMKAAMLEGQKESVVTDYILKILGLEVCADTIVGNQMLRGFSGGQKKRVTIGEMLVGPAKTLFMDEISTGLDSSTTFQIVNSLRQTIHILGGTAVIAFLQPAPETYNLFDDIILLSDGQIVYQGPREHVLEFFESIGFKCPDRKGVADFLQEVTSSKDQQQYWTNKDEPYRFISVKEFADEFQSFHVGSKIGDA